MLSLTLIPVYYQLFDTSGILRVVDCNSFIQATDDYTGQLDLKNVHPPRSVSDIVQAIAEQEGCPDTFDSSEWSLYQSSTSSAALPEDDPFPHGAGSQCQDPLLLRFDADVGIERNQGRLGTSQMYLRLAKFDIDNGFSPGMEERCSDFRVLSFIFGSTVV